MAVRHFGFSKFANSTIIVLGFCIVVQNFAKIRQSTVALWPTIMISNIASVRHLECKNLNFGEIVFIVDLCTKCHHNQIIFH